MTTALIASTDETTYILVEAYIPGFTLTVVGTDGYSQVILDEGTAAEAEATLAEFAEDLPRLGNPAAVVAALDADRRTNATAFGITAR
jgi:hypothetical protein